MNLTKDFPALQFAMQISSKMAKISLFFESLEIGCTPPIQYPVALHCLLLIYYNLLQTHPFAKVQYEIFTCGHNIIFYKKYNNQLR